MTAVGIRNLWIGGSSGLACTYFNTFQDDERWILLGRETTKPDWMRIDDVFVSLNLSDDYVKKPAGFINNELMEQLSDVTKIVIGIRPPLVTWESNDACRQRNDRIVRGLSRFFLWLLATNGRSIEVILHISSVAAVDHTAEQRNVSEKDEQAPSSFKYPYDAFKYDCEQLVKTFAMACDCAYTNIRTSAIFSDAPSECIQCTALAMQCRLGTYTPFAIDCNSARNVAHLICLMLQRYNVNGDKKNSPSKLRPVYYYTRPTKLGIVPYGDSLAYYRLAHGIERYYIDLPYWIMPPVVRIIHILAYWLWFVPYLPSIDYLLQVASREHSFDMTCIMEDVPELKEKEETILECFQRHRAAAVRVKGDNRKVD